MPRVPLADDFGAFAVAGRRLAELHLGYETCPEHPLEMEFLSPGEPELEHFRIGARAMRFEDDDRTVLTVNDHLRLKGIPPRAHEYQVNGRTPLEWFIDRYRIVRDNRSGIVNDPNRWFDDPRDLIAAFARIVHGSAETRPSLPAFPPFPSRREPPGGELNDGSSGSREWLLGESETLEFKGTTGTRREAARTVCAMLNQHGGQVLFGVTPEGHVSGQQVSERTIEEVSAELARIDPPAFPAIERIPVKEGREVVAVTVVRGQARPYMYRGNAYRRVGNTTVEIHTGEYRQMLFERMHSERRWENQPAEGWSVDELTRTRSAPPWRERSASGSKIPEPRTPRTCFEAWDYRDGNTLGRRLHVPPRTNGHVRHAQVSAPPLAASE